MTSLGTEMRKIRLAVFLAIGILTVLVVTVVGSFIATYTYPSNGSVVTPGSVTAKSGSVKDIQAAINQAINSRMLNVTIPAGTFVFNATDTFRVNINVPQVGLNIFGAGIDKTVLDMPDTTVNFRTTMFRANGESGGKLRISGITFKGRSHTWSGDTGILIESAKDFRIDHCSFWDMGGDGITIYDDDVMYDHPKDFSKVSQGVIDHDSFYDIYKEEADPHMPGVDPNIGSYGYGVAVSRSYNYVQTPWEDAWNLFGRYLRNTYIEDCYFTGNRHAVTGNFAGAYVLRNSVIEDIMSAPWAECATTGHPVREKVYGMLSAEIYNVTIRKTGTKPLGNVNQMYGIHHESGSGLYYNNRLVNLLEAFQVGDAEYNNPEFQPQGNTRETYFWNNTVINCATEFATIDNSPSGAPAPTLGVQWFKQSPNQLGKNYQPYTYPHPLTLASVQATTSGYSGETLSNILIATTNGITPKRLNIGHLPHCLQCYE